MNKQDGRLDEEFAKATGTTPAPYCFLHAGQRLVLNRHRRLVCPVCYSHELATPRELAKERL